MPNPQARSSSKATAGSRPIPSAPISNRQAAALGAVQIDEGLKGLYATGLFQDIKIRQAGGRLIVTVVENPVINRIAFEGNNKAKDEQLLGEIQSKVRGTLSRPDGAVRHAAPDRTISPQRPLRRARGAEDHRTAEQPRRSRFRNHRRHEDRRQDHPLRRQSRLFRFPAQGRDQDLRDQSAELPEIVRHLRSGSHRGRPRSAAALLSEARLCRRAHHLGGQRIRSGREGLHRDLHHRRGRPIHVRHRRHPVERARGRGRPV